MRKPVVSWLVLVASAAPIAAQSLWTPQIGLQGGYTRIKPAGTGADDAIGLIDLPGSSYATAIYGYGSVFAVIPSSRRVALEIQAGASQITTEATGSASVLRSTLRVNYALSPRFYVGAGGSLLFLDAGSAHESQLGVHAAAGYRRALTGSLHGRVELQATFNGKADLLPPLDSYAAVVGVSAAVGGHAATREGPAARARAWEPAVGLTAGYLRTRIVGDSAGADVASIALPGFGSSFAPIGLAIPAPTTLFVILPVGTKLAVEGGLDVHAIHQSSSGTGTAINVSGRLDYAVRGGWYAAAGGGLTNFSPASGNSGTLTSGSVAWGYRFGLGRGIGGRLEASFHMQQSNSDLNAPAMNTFALLFGTSVPLR